MRLSGSPRCQWTQRIKVTYVSVLPASIPRGRNYRTQLCLYLSKEWYLYRFVREGQDAHPYQWGRRHPVRAVGLLSLTQHYFRSDRSQRNGCLLCRDPCSQVNAECEGSVQPLPVRSGDANRIGDWSEKYAFRSHEQVYKGRPKVRGEQSR